ncbi:MAG: dihydroorotate dehydrogenase electron transfer subunit [Thermofilum sp.]
MHKRGRVVGASLACEQVMELKVEVDLPQPTPGQFVMLWVPGVGEVPMSIADYEEGLLRLFITKRGLVTSYIHERAKPGWEVFVRGPYGRGFTIPAGGRVLLVGGGTGAAPLHFLAKLARGAECVAALGFKSSKHVLLLEDIGKYCRVHVATDDGSAGFAGPVHKLAESLLASESFSKLYTCGPEPMIAELLRLAEEAGIPLEASLERCMRCAVGVCGSCVLDPLGLRVCRDGPVFDGDTLRGVWDLGRWWRGADGSKVPLKA